MKNSTLHSIGEAYSDEREDKLWDAHQQETIPEIGRNYADVLKREGLLPADKTLSGFVLYSPSSNQRAIEIEFARELNDLAKEVRPQVKPAVYTSDIFGKFVKENTFDPSGKMVEQEVFVPEFEGQMKKFENAETLSFSASAHSIPLENNSVNLVWDRLGALWHVMDYARSVGEDVEVTVKELLDEYKRVLKSDGVLVLDAGESPFGASVSTYTYLERYYKLVDAASPMNGVDLDKLGWSVAVEGEGDYKIAILKPKPESVSSLN